MTPRPVLLIATLLVALHPLRAAAFSLVGEGWDGPGPNPHVIQFYFGRIDTWDGHDPAAVRAAFYAATEVWSEATLGHLVFVEVYQPNLPNTIDIHWIDEDSHFPAEAMAHSYYAAPPNPEPLAGDIHLNPAANWAVERRLPGDGYDLMRVAVHELGHSLGLDHSPVPAAAMYATIPQSEPFDALHDDDVRGICELYLCGPEAEHGPLLLLGAYGLYRVRRTASAA